MTPQETMQARMHDRLPVILKAENGTPEPVKDVKCLHVPGAKGVPFWVPEQQTPPGTGLEGPDGGKLPKLFTPLKIRGITMPNRIWVSPMCQYSALEGFQSPWHVTHYGGMAQRGPGLMMTEAAAVQARGRITPEDSGIWQDAHIEGHRKHTEFAHAMNSLIAIQIAHAGRKASTVPPWLGGTVSHKEAGGWPEDVMGPGTEPFDANSCDPREMTIAEIEELKKDFVAAAIRSVKAGYDVVELHFAHGYLMSSFLSPAVNKRTDKYGGSFENRVRFALETVEAVRAVLPESMPLFVRISATDWLDNNPEWKGENWTVEQSIKLAELFAERGVDVLDVSSGGIHSMQKVKGGVAYQAPFAKKIKKALGDKILVSAVGNITTGTLAEELITGGKDEDDVPLDLIAAGRMFQKNPGLVWAWADDLDTKIQIAHQIRWGFAGRGGSKTKTTEKAKEPARERDADKISVP